MVIREDGLMHENIVQPPAASSGGSGRRCRTAGRPAFHPLRHRDAGSRRYRKSACTPCPRAEKARVEGRGLRSIAGRRAGRAIDPSRNCGFLRPSPAEACAEVEAVEGNRHRASRQAEQTREPEGNGRHRESGCHACRSHGDDPADRDPCGVAPDQFHRRGRRPACLCAACDHLAPRPRKPPGALAALEIAGSHCKPAIACRRRQFGCRRPGYRRPRCL